MGVASFKGCRDSNRLCTIQDPTLIPNVAPAKYASELLVSDPGALERQGGLSLCKLAPFPDGISATWHRLCETGSQKPLL